MLQTLHAQQGLAVLPPGGKTAGNAPRHNPSGTDPHPWARDTFFPQKALFCKAAQTPGAQGLLDLHRQQMTAPGVQGIPKQTLPWHLIQVTIPDLTVVL